MQMDKLGKIVKKQIMETEKVIIKSEIERFRKEYPYLYKRLLEKGVIDEV
jgi:hypothetical protein